MAPTCHMSKSFRESALLCASARLHLHICQLRLCSEFHFSTSEHLWQTNSNEVVSAYLVF